MIHFPREDPDYSHWDDSLRISPCSSPDYSSHHNDPSTAPRDREGYSSDATPNIYFRHENRSLALDSDMFGMRPQPQFDSKYPFVNTLAPPNLHPGLLSPRSVIQASHQHTRRGIHPNTDDLAYPYHLDFGSDISSSFPSAPSIQQPASSTSASGPSSGIIPRTDGRSFVATTKIREAATRRRMHAASAICKICHSDFTTAYALNRHMISHTGRRDFPCAKEGCQQSFSTDSGRKRHEKSPTLHKLQGQPRASVSPHSCEHDFHVFFRCQS